MLKNALVIAYRSDYMVDDTKIGQHYDRVEFQKGPVIYSRSDLYDAMFQLGDFNMQREEPYIIMDAMCGAGLVGKEISKRLADQELAHLVHYVDVAEEKLRKLAAEGNVTTKASVFELPYEQDFFDRVYSRFGVKNYPPEEQKDIFRRFRFVMRPDGIFVLCDMESPRGAYEFMQAERREKHKYTGLEGGEPHIPTRDLWFQLLRESGLEPQRVSETKSYVTTTDWVNSKQMTEDDLVKMNAFLLAAPGAAKRELNIREDGGLVKIDYPVVVISAKPA